MGIGNTYGPVVRVGVTINFDNTKIVTERRKIPARLRCKVRINRCVCLCQRSMKGWAHKRWTEKSDLVEGKRTKRGMRRERKGWEEQRGGEGVSRGAGVDHVVWFSTDSLSLSLSLSLSPSFSLPPSLYPLLSPSPYRYVRAYIFINY